MFRTAVTAAAGALLASGALSACGPVKMGTAATVGDERITTAQLDDTVAQWRKEFAANRQVARVQQAAEQQGQRLALDPDSPHRSALYQLIGFKVWDEVAKQQGITVPQGQVDGLLGRLGGASIVSVVVLAADIPERYANDVLRVILIRLALLQRYGAVPNAQGQLDPAVQRRALQQSDAAYSAAARRLDVAINPRFRGFDPGRAAPNPVEILVELSRGGSGPAPAALKPIPYELSKTESGTG